MDIYFCIICSDGILYQNREFKRIKKGKASNFSVKPYAKHFRYRQERKLIDSMPVLLSLSLCMVP